MMLAGVDHRCVLVAALVFASAGVGMPVLAQEAAMEMLRPVDAGRPAQAPERSLSDAVRHVQRTTGGRILGAERVPFDGRDINRVKYMDDRGRVRYMDDPGTSHRVRHSRPPDPTPRRANP